MSDALGSLILHPQTKVHVAQFLQQPSHALLLVGDAGAGKTHLAQTITASILDDTTEKLGHYPYFSLVRGETGSISIDAIRELQRFLQLKTLGDRSIRRAIIVEYADTLTTEAQNAYLKLLEEPPADTVMILTGSNIRGFLPTILSRVQIIAVHAPAEEDVRTHFAKRGKSEQAINQAYFLSGGLPGLMHALLDDDITHPLMTGVMTAKNILQQTTFERLAQVDALSKQKHEATYAVTALQHIARTGLAQAAAKSDAARIKQWHHILKVSSEAADALTQNANVKLVLSNLMLQL